MNAQSLQGGAFGMRISSINKVIKNSISVILFIQLFPSSWWTLKHQIHRR